MFQLTKEEVKELSRSKILTLNNEFLRSNFLTSKNRTDLEHNILRSKISTSKTETRGGRQYSPQKLNALLFLKEQKPV